jgi:phospholipid/cholesterol/gamma-HCH transport system substrate-binding protein
MKKFDAEFLVGLFLFGLIAILLYVSLQLGQVDLFTSSGYEVRADFSSAGGLQDGAVIEIAGVQIGRVEAIKLVDYQAQVTLRLNDGVTLHADAEAEIKTKGLIGERYVEITPGRNGERIPPGGRLRKTLAPIDIQDVIAQFIFGNVESNELESKDLLE